MIAHAVSGRVVDPGAAGASPGPDSEPVLPIDLADGSLRDEVWKRWLARDPVRMVDGHLDALRGLRAISLECGLEDEFNLYVGTAMLHRRLDDAGIAHRYAPLTAWLAARLA